MEKYKSNLTYVYKYLNSNIYEESLKSYEFNRQQFERMRRTLELISYFHPELSPEDFESEEERKLGIRKTF